MGFCNKNTYRTIDVNFISYYFIVEVLTMFVSVTLPLAHLMEIMDGGRKIKDIDAMKRTCPIDDIVTLMINLPIRKLS